MSDNVIVLGAGFSRDAGIPLLSNFIERMWEYSIRGRSNNEILSEHDKKIISEALEIRREMDGYHGRVAFDDRNIEDILSMLAFNQMAGGVSDKNKLKAFTAAISKTIELSCNIKHTGIPENRRNPYQIITEGPEIYRRFWKAIFNWYSSNKNMPTIITFNYDLVLERSLFQVLINTHFNRGNKAPFDNISIDYHYKKFPRQVFCVEYTAYTVGVGFNSDPGTIIKPSSNENNVAEVDILKLHGSLNFPDGRSKIDNDVKISLTNTIDNPYILPPVSNKQTNNNGIQSWGMALQKLREAKNVVFVGYSLPKTDMYMQFFLKSALGPNQELNKIFVYDPVLWKDSGENVEMRNRYEKCFSEQMRPRIIFNPKEVGEKEKKHFGSTEHFVSTLERCPSEIFF